MKERPILFSGPMVRALLAGTKTQTRRILKPQPNPIPAAATDRVPGEIYTSAWFEGGDAPPYVLERCPYGVPGDRLWCREGWALREDVDWRTRPEKAKHYACYRASYPGDLRDEYHPTAGWKSARFMPRVLSRLTLEVTEVRVQRLQEISEEDAKAEGLEWVCPTYGVKGIAASWNGDPRESYRALWDEINEKRAPWVWNPWVWAITFRRVP